MSTPGFESELKRLFAQIAFIGDLSRSDGKYAVGNFIRGINDTLTRLEGITVPPHLIEAQHEAVAEVREAKAVIDQEWNATPLNLEGYEPITSPMQDQAERIKRAIRAFDVKATRA